MTTFHEPTHMLGTGRARCGHAQCRLEVAPGGSSAPASRLRRHSSPQSPRCTTERYVLTLSLPAGPLLGAVLEWRCYGCGLLAVHTVLCRAVGLPRSNSNSVDLCVGVSVSAWSACCLAACLLVTAAHCRTLPHRRADGLAGPGRAPRARDPASARLFVASPRRGTAGHRGAGRGNSSDDQEERDRGRIAAGGSQLTADRRGRGAARRGRVRWGSPCSP